MGKAGCDARSVHRCGHLVEDVGGLECYCVFACASDARLRSVANDNSANILETLCWVCAVCSRDAPVTGVRELARSRPPLEDLEAHGRVVIPDSRRSRSPRRRHSAGSPPLLLHTAASELTLSLHTHTSATPIRMSAVVRPTQMPDTPHLSRKHRT